MAQQQLDMGIILDEEDPCFLVLSRHGLHSILHHVIKGGRFDRPGEGTRRGPVEAGLACPRSALGRAASTRRWPTGVGLRVPPVGAVSEHERSNSLCRRFVEEGVVWVVGVNETTALYVGSEAGADGVIVGAGNVAIAADEWVGATCLLADDP